MKLDGEAQFKAAIGNINQELRVLSSEMGMTVSAFDKNGASISDLKAKGDVYEKQLGTQKEKLEVLNNALKAAEEAQAKAAQTAAEMAEKYGADSTEAQKASEAVAAVTKKLNDYQIQANNTTKNINQLEAAQKANNEEITKLQNAKFDKLTEEFKKIASEAGKAASEVAKIAANTITSGIEAGVKAFTAYTGAVTGAATAVTALGKKSVKIGASFEQGMSEVAATMGMTVEDINNGSEAFEMLEQAAKDAGSTTQFSATQAAEALNYLALAGYSAEEASAALPNVLNLAAAGGMDLASASDLATDACSALGLGVDDLDTLMNKMARASQKSNMSVSQVGEATLVCAGTATSFGLSLNAVNANLGVLANNGIKGAEGGTKLRNILLSLSSPTDNAAAQLEALGVAVSENGEFRDLNLIMQDLDNSLSDLSDEEKINAISTIFNKADISAVNALLKGCGDEYGNLVSEIENADGAAADMADTMLNNLNGSITILQSSLEGVGIQAYEIIEGPVKDVVDETQTLVSGFSEALGSGGIEGAIQYVNDIIPSIGESLVNGLSEIVPGFLEGFNGIVLAIAESVTETLPTVIDSLLPVMIKSCTELITGLVQKIPSLVPPLLKGAITLFRGILDGLNQVISQLTPMLLVIISDISNELIKNAPILLSRANDFFFYIISAIAEALPSILESVGDLVYKIGETLVEEGDMIIYAGLKLFTSLTESLPDAIVEIVAALPELIDGIVFTLLDALPQMIQAGIDLFVALIDAFPEIIETIVDALPQIINSIVTALLTFIPQIIQAGVTLFLALIDALPEIVIAIVDSIPQIIDGIVNGLGESTPLIIQAGFDLFVSLISDLPRIIIELVAAIPQIISSIVNAFKESFGKMKEIGANLIVGIGDGLIEGVTAVKDKIKSAGDKIMSSFKEYFGIASPSKVMKKELGFNLANGVGVGFSEQMERVSADMKKSVPTSFDLDVDVNSSAMYRKKYSAIASEAGGGVNFTQINNSPKALDAETINRNTRQGLQLATVMR